MILLDTNIVSEGMRSAPDTNVRAWLDARRSTDLFICTPVLAELRYGVERLPAGARRTRLEATVRSVEAAFAGRILPFDRVAAHAYGRIVAHRDRLGRATGTMDAMIAAIRWPTKWRSPPATRRVFPISAWT
ncbi:PilT protein [Rhodovulum sp. PH10]|uniref:type II toxin-antitoxin system VapC family toxin n=1 Tax=Rhodovulum sp. PH10 TaxID=1187851 RepID=UPI00027C23F6|nr:type II toxin-antitoxin system VapC family toxin [Rhodovulum sp. PH10]EJW10254.1 PilT protein [Rhodovulum sp. PH10]